MRIISLFKERKVPLQMDNNVPFLLWRKSNICCYFPYKSRPNLVVIESNPISSPPPKKKNGNLMEKNFTFILLLILIVLEL